MHLTKTSTPDTRRNPVRQVYWICPVTCVDREEERFSHLMCFRAAHFMSNAMYSACDAIISSGTAYDMPTTTSWRYQNAKLHYSSCCDVGW